MGRWLSSHSVSNRIRFNPQATNECKPPIATPFPEILSFSKSGGPLIHVKGNPVTVLQIGPFGSQYSEQIMGSD